MRTLVLAALFCGAALAQSVTISTPVFTGSGLNDATSGGRSTVAPANAVYAVAISATGTPDSFKWQKNGGTISSAIPITGAAQAITDGVTITFAATTGHTLAAAWAITATASGSLSAQTFMQRGVGAAFRNAQEKARETLSVTDFGADPTGVTDSTAAFTAGIAAAEASGSVLLVPAGTFLTNTATSGVILNITAPGGSSLTIRGAGSGVTIIKTTLTGVDLMAAITSSFALPQHILSGFTLQGPDYNGSSVCPSATSGNGLRISGAAVDFHSIYSDIRSHGFCGSGKAGMWLDSVENSSLRDAFMELNDWGLKLTTAPNAITFDNVHLNQNATYGGNFDNIQSDTFNNLTVQSNLKTGLIITNSNSNVFNAPHFENNNISATAGVFGLDLRGTLGNFVLGNVWNGAVFQGTHENIGLTGVSGGTVSLNKFIGGLSSSAANPFAVSNGFFGTALFDGITSITKVTDPNFQLTILNDTATGFSYYPTPVSNGYSQVGQVLKATSAALGGGALTAGTCSTISVSVPGVQSTDVVNVSPTTNGVGSNQFYWYGYFTGLNLINVAVCATTAGTPISTTYAVRVIK